MFKLNSSNEDAQLASTGNYVKPGFHEDMELKSVVMEKSKKGDDTIVFEFEGSKGKYTHKEYAMDRTHDKYQLKFEQWMGNRLGHIFSAFISEEKVRGVENSMKDPNSFLEWCQIAIATLATQNVGKKCKLKIVHDSYSGYAKFPTFPNFIATEFNGLELVQTKHDVFDAPTDKPDTQKDQAASTSAAADDGFDF